MEMRGREGWGGERSVTVTGEEFFFHLKEEGQNLGEGAESIWKRCDKGGRTGLAGRRITEEAV